MLYFVKGFVALGVIAITTLLLLNFLSLYLSFLIAFVSVFTAVRFTEGEDRELSNILLIYGVIAVVANLGVYIYIQFI